MFLESAPGGGYPVEGPFVLWAEGRGWGRVSRDFRRSMVSVLVRSALLGPKGVPCCIVVTSNMRSQQG